MAPSTVTSRRHWQGMMLSARAVRTSLGALAQARSTFRRLSAEQTTGIDWRARQMAQNPPRVGECAPAGAIASGRSETEPSKYDPVVPLLVALNTPSGCTRASSYRALRGQNMVACPGLGTLSVLGGHTSNAASEGCHSIAQLIMSDLHCTWNHG